jgi:hypothetical protein
MATTSWWERDIRSILDGIVNLLTLKKIQCFVGESVGRMICFPDHKNIVLYLKGTLYL